MITDPQLMPDFRDGLEQALYRRASAAAVPSPARRLPRVLPRPTVGGRLALGLAVLIAAIAVVFTALPGKKTGRTALAEPTILTQPVQPVPPEITAGIIVRQTLGPNATFTGVIPLRVFDQSVYLAQAPTGWCVVPQQGASGTSTPTASINCATTEQIVRVGFSVIFASSTYLGIIPPRAAPPTLVRTNGAQSVLPVSKDGLATVTGLVRGDKVIRHAVDGTTVTDEVL